MFKWRFAGLAATAKFLGGQKQRGPTGIKFENLEEVLGDIVVFVGE
jgi:hypothetical protein